MAGKTQLWEEEEIEINLLGLRSPYSIVQLAFYLNKNAGFRFSKVIDDLGVLVKPDTHTSFVLFSQKEEHQQFFLVSNISLEKNPANTTHTLFDVPEVFPLIPSHKKINAWLCWESEGSSHEVILNRIKPLQNILNAEKILPSQCKNNKRLVWLF
ncbi:MAG: IPExxxVDY family protein [Cryomorphaceae bacterium]|nr:IPExxxVDY family protein [Cryomorphaceae bacterium]